MATVLLVTAIASTLASGAVSYVGAQRNAKAQEYAADAAEAQGNYNATIASNNAQGRVNDLAFQESQLALGKNIEMQKAERERILINQKINTDLAKTKNMFATEGGTFEDVFKSEETLAYDKLASFDFDAGQANYGYSKQAGEVVRQSGQAYALGQADRAMTLSAAANQATQFRNQASATRTAAVGSLLGSVSSASSMGAQGYADGTFS
jgi:hypothetical protein|tara:strand:- start:7741 stop:8367 length:627 start_codon:yes stop_codon:yes gene_type:complete